MIARLWHGWTKPEHAAAYERLLRTKILPGIHRVAGYKGAQLMRRDVPLHDAAGDSREVEFITLTFWDSWEAIQEFSGPEGTHAVVPEEAQALLSRFDDHSLHYTSDWVD